MPPITLHMVLARAAAAIVGQPLLHSEDGPFVLGSTSPDIRVLTRQDRYSTHFFDLADHAHQDSVTAFLTTHGRYAAPDRLNHATRAWVCGYIAHLAMDEEYITGVYRRFFAAHEALGGQLRANVMDRLLQFELDRRHGDEPDLKQTLCQTLACTVEGIEVAGFIERETLDRWREVSSEIAARNMDWSRMRTMVSNHLRYAGLEEGQTLGDFLDSLPELLDATIAHVTDAELDGFVRRSTEVAAKAIERYLA